jgi:hypothetical protein
MEKIVWTDRVRKNKKKKRRKADWIGHILCRNCLLKHVEGKMEEKLEVAERRRRRRK